MLDQASLKLLLRARAELISSIFLIGRRVRRKKVHDLTRPPPAHCDVAPSIPVPPQGYGGLHSFVSNAIRYTRAMAAEPDDREP